MVQDGKSVSTGRSQDEKVGLRLLVEKNRDPVRPRRIRRIARVASADRKLAPPLVAQQTQRPLRRHFRTALRVVITFRLS